MAKKVNTITRGGARYYVHPETGEKAIGVTSVLNMLPKDFLGPWNAKQVATAAVDMLPELVGLAIKGQQQAAIDMLKRTTYRDVKGAASQGTEAHGFMDDVLHGRKVARQHPDVEKFIEHVRDFVKVVQPKVLYTEEAIWNQTHNFSGRFDALLEVDGLPVWFDGKTTRSGVHPEVALQLTAYSYTDFILLEDGTQVAVPKAADGGRIKKGLVFHFRPEGWSLVPVDLPDELFTEVFIPLLQVARNWEKGLPGEQAPKERVLGAAMVTRSGGKLYDSAGREINEEE